MCYVGKMVSLLFPQERKGYDKIKINRDSIQTGETS